MKREISRPLEKYRISGQVVAGATKDCNSDVQPGCTDFKPAHPGCVEILRLTATNIGVDFLFPDDLSSPNLLCVCS